MIEQKPMKAAELYEKIDEIIELFELSRTEGVNYAGIHPCALMGIIETLKKETTDFEDRMFI